MSSIFGGPIANYVTTNTNQSITGLKTFTGLVTCNDGIVNTDTMPASSNSSTIVPTTAWVQSAITSGNYVTTNTNQSITGLKTFTGLVTCNDGIVNTDTMPASSNSSTIVPTTAWVQSAITAAPIKSSHIVTYSNWIGLPIVVNCNANSTSTILTFNIPISSQVRRYRIASVFDSKVPGQTSVSAFTLQGVFYTDGALQLADNMKIGAGFNQNSPNQDFMFPGSASLSGIYAGCAFMGGAANTSQYTNQYAYEYVAEFAPNAQVQLKFTSNSSFNCVVLYKVCLYYD